MPVNIANGNLIDADTVLRTLSAPGYVVSGLDASKAAVPAVGQIYLATDTKVMYVCFVAGTWLSIGAPANLVAHTTDTSPPTNWTEFTAGRGRVIVGMPNGGTSAGTVGTALTNLQDKTHTHTYNTVIAHTHAMTSTGVSDPAQLKNSGVVNNSTVDLGALTQSTGSASGTTATAATSDTIPYVQQLGIIKL